MALNRVQHKSGLDRPHQDHIGGLDPSLSFVEYNCSQEGFFTPLVYFLAGHYLDPWDAGEGGPKIEFFSGWFWLCLVSEWAPKNWFPIFYNFWVRFWIPIFWGSGFFGRLLGAFFGLLRLPWEASVAKNLKKTIGFLWFLQMKVFGSLKLLMALLGSSWPSWATLIPKWVPKWVSTFFEKVVKKHV